MTLSQLYSDVNFVCLSMFSCRAELVRERAAAADRQLSPREREREGLGFRALSRPTWHCHVQWSVTQLENLEKVEKDLCIRSINIASSSTCRLSVATAYLAKPFVRVQNQDWQRMF